MTYEGYTMIEWLWYHHEQHDRLSRKEVVQVMIRWNLIYLKHLYEYNQQNPKKRYYDWLYVCDPEIDLTVYFYLQEVLPSFIPTIQWINYVEKDQHCDLFYYYYIQKTFHWEDIYDSDFTKNYPHFDILSSQWNQQILLHTPILSVSTHKSRDQWMEWFARQEFGNFDSERSVPLFSRLEPRKKYLLRSKIKILFSRLSIMLQSSRSYTSFR